ncbi:hypothetical protein D3C86_1958060 [compost metagenome]
MLGHSFEKPSVYLRPVAQTISQIPAISNHAHANSFCSFQPPRHAHLFAIAKVGRRRGNPAILIVRLPGVNEPSGCCHRTHVIVVVIAAGYDGHAVACPTAFTEEIRHAP